MLMISSPPRANPDDGTVQSLKDRLVSVQGVTMELKREEFIAWVRFGLVLSRWSAKSWQSMYGPWSVYSSLLELTVMHNILSSG